MMVLSNLDKFELYFISYMVLINFITFLSFALDKFKARKQKNRIPEFTLLVLSLIGGSLGGLMSMVVFKHKLSKKKFYIGVPTMILINKIIELIIFNFIK